MWWSEWDMLEGIFIPHEIESIAYFYALPEGTNVHYSMTLVKTYWRLFNQLIMELMSIITRDNCYIQIWQTIAFIHLQMLTCRFFWKGGNSSVELSSMKVPNFKILGHKLSETNVNTKTGKIVDIFSVLYIIVNIQLFDIFNHLTLYVILGRYNRLKCHFFLKRMIDKFVHK